MIVTRPQPCPIVIVTRFAPSPTGLLHLGHAFAALFARDAGERFLLRLEDIDAARCRPEYDAAILEDLQWLGLDFVRPVLRQSTRMAAYSAALGTLEKRGLLYPCFCTRQDIADEIARSAEAPHGPDGPIYPGTCRSLSGEERGRRMASGEAYALRLDVVKAARAVGDLFFEEKGVGPRGETGRIAVQPLLFGDVVLARKEMPAAYHLAVVVDDAFQDVTLVTRGNDLFAASHIQRVLQALLGLPAPAYAHHRLILDEQGRKFSKRDRAATLRALRESGVTPEQIRARIAGRI
ncbi:MAG: tRNA glutamyl-Q(34) synthetase GluQRS [Alphaproteobacteria bacterium]|nr:tRNA glutamyl-Q(34) synthetase GluQRS [Alphaproteobacteria bacterium]